MTEASRRDRKVQIERRREEGERRQPPIGRAYRSVHPSSVTIASQEAEERLTKMTELRREGEKEIRARFIRR